MRLTMDFIGVAMLAAGAYAGYWARRRRFDRTNAFGIETSRTYWDRLKGQAGDQALRGISLTVFAAGIVLLAWTNLDSWGWIVVGPISITLLFGLLGT